MTPRSIILALFASLALSAACSSSSNQGAGAPATGETAPAAAPAAPAAAVPTPTQGTVLGHVEFQKHTVTIYSTESGPRYDLVSEQGTVARALSRDEFQTRFPELFEAFETANARIDASAPLEDRDSPER